MTRTQPPLPDIDRDLDANWPAPGYRSGQQRIYKEAASVLFGDTDHDIIVIDAPTGVGKSVINTALCNLANSSFYTTPQKSLRDQLVNDSLLNGYVNTLRARKDYICDYASSPGDPVNCAECHVNNTDIEKCSDHSGCQYWNAKERAIESKIAGLTFAYLRIDGFIPVVNPNSDDQEQISFGDRELLIVDEAHSIEQQYSSMFAGFKLTPELSTNLEELGIGESLRSAIPDSLFHAEDPSHDLELAPLEDHIVSNDLIDDLFGAKEDAIAELQNHRKRYARLVKGAIRRKQNLETGLSEAELQAQISEGMADFIENLKLPESIDMRMVDAKDYPSQPLSELRNEIEKEIQIMGELRDFVSNIEVGFSDEYDPEENPWFVDVNTGPLTATEYKFNPANVGDLLKQQIWNRADKVVLSSATIPSHGATDRKEGILKWVDRIGLDPESTHVITEDSPFPVENRRVRIDYIGNMSSGGFDANIDEISRTINELSTLHPSEKGLVHVSSYKQASHLGETIDDLSDVDVSVTVHKKEQDAESALATWQGGQSDSATYTGTQILITPSMKEGVDLAGDKCRWQVATKVPYPNLADPRVRYLQENRGWSWYHSEATTELVQAAGRGVRSAEDNCEFYVLDEAFKNVWHLAPSWYCDAVTSESRPD
ncbi:helicase C-terminal domain-containing protein [Natrinema longum]|uniref:DEAD/DEAH box helicase family protein n=1 Tax=Natrinema longum TaxID=370324 RepID=A0A8A2UCY6_9EURY|nr:helicase C-terminal domain-containing protein [Natrinema longum]MBZ6496003.1 DEAD/DEAH box helicase family protein [Natrinema longum]QSW86065.1 DEAD/DEAH box helicase family protein [Natrinema longum]